MNEQIAISVSNLTKTYNLYNKPQDRLKEALHPLRRSYHQEFYALNNITLDIKKGETIGIIGHNGAGKSTLLKILTGVLNPTSGDVEIKGKIASLLELGAGFNLEMSGLENIYLNGTLMGFSKKEMDKKIDAIIEFADIGDFIHQPTKMYSSGMFARLAFAVSINVEPDILIVDEALSVGDIKFQIKCVNKFKELKEKGITILFVSHDISMIRNFCDRAVWLDNGSIRDIGDVLDVTAQYTKFMYGENDSDSSSKTEQKELAIQNDETLDDKPINRWGTKVGVIESVKLLNSIGKAQKIFNLNDPIIVKVIINVKDINSEFFSIALSIKDRSGTDLIVSTTKDNNKFLDTTNDKIELTFEIINYLANGEYIIAIAAEDREDLYIPKYYDYIEGAAYFKSEVPLHLFGLFNMPISQDISYS